MNRMQKLILMILFSIQVTACFGQNEVNSKQIEKHFNAKERKELAKIVAYVDSLVLSKTESMEINKSYHQYLDMLYENATNSDFEWAFDQKMKYEFLSSIDTVVFNKIWFKLTTSRIIKTKDTTLYNPENFISINLDSKREFARLVHDLGKNNGYYRSFYDAIEISGALSPSIVGGFLYNHKDFDFDNINNRLWAAVFLLTLEESVEKKVKRYLNE
jgi:hypothetical protein